MKKILLILVSFIGLVFFANINALNAQEVQSTAGDTVNINYFRYAADFDGWQMWLWPEGGNGKFVEFDTVDGNWATASIDLTDEENAAYVGVERFGVLVVRGEWLERDIEYDRYIELKWVGSECFSYLGQGDGNIGYTLDDPNGPDTSHKFLTAGFIDETTIEFSATTELSSYQILVDGVVDSSVTQAAKDGFTYTVNISGEADLKKKYEVQSTFDGDVKTIEVGFSALYNTESFEKEFDYDGDLGVIYSKDKSTFKVWSPLADKITLRIYEYGLEGYDNDGKTRNTVEVPVSHPMTKGDKGVYEVTVNGDLHGKYYTFVVERGVHINEIIDPYAYSAGANGIRGMIVDFSRTNPDDWKYGERPDTAQNYTDNIIYELHVRDLTSHSSWNGTEDNRGKFLGLVEEGTTYDGYTTGFDHIKELGVTSVHLLPCHDYGFVDETKLNEVGYFDKTDGGFNWGYMTENYNTLEGSYSTNPFDGESRVSEFKEMVQGFTNNDIRVIMDVVYNHTSKSADSNFNILMPGYYHRLNSTGGFSNGSGCGNETASERTMMNKLIVDSIIFYATEYNISGFRFDLMKLHDYETMNDVAAAVHAIDPSIIIYGEPWDAGGAALDEELSAGKENIDKMPNVAIFNDVIRDAVKGSVFDSAAGGFVQGAFDDGTVSSIKSGLTGTNSASQMVNYVSAHDNNTLYDKLRLTGLRGDQLNYAHMQANAIVMLSQGIPFLHAGVEMCRTKPSEVEGELYSHNSYNESDAVNQFRWDKKEANIDMFNYYKSLIELRKSHSAFRMMDDADIADHITFLDSPDGTIVMQISDNANGDIWDDIIIAFNNTSSRKTFDIPAGEWTVVADKLGFTTNDDVYTMSSGSINSYETLILYKGVTQPTTESSSNVGLIVSVIVGTIVLAGAGVGVFLFLKKKS